MSRSARRSVCCVFIAAWLAATPLHAMSASGGGCGMGGMTPPALAAPQVYYVPWEVVGQAGSIPDGSLLVLCRFPGSSDDARSSELTNSRVLTSDSAQCVALALVPADVVFTTLKQDSVFVELTNPAD